MPRVASSPGIIRLNPVVAGIASLDRIYLDACGHGGGGCPCLYDHPVMIEGFGRGVAKLPIQVELAANGGAIGAQQIFKEAWNRRNRWRHGYDSRI
jgi:hypothetical protein